MKIMELVYVSLLIFLPLIVKNAGRKIISTPKCLTEFTKVISENLRINKGNIPQKENVIAKYSESQRLKLLMEEILLKGENKVISEQLLPPNYYERKSVIGNVTTAKLNEDKQNINNSTNEDNKNAQPDVLSTNITRERLLDQMENTVPVVELSTNKTRFDDHSLPASISENSFSFAHNGANHTKVNEPDTTERRATISIHIYSTREEGMSDHSVDHLGKDAKLIRGNETLKQQLDFLQRNAENVKKQQHIVGENDVYILTRGEYTDEDPTDKVVALVTNTSKRYTPKFSTSYNNKTNPLFSANGSPELPMPVVQPIDTNDGSSNSYVVGVSKNTTTAIKRGQQKEIIYLSIGSLFNDSHKASKPPNQSIVKELPTESRPTEMSLYGDRISELQGYASHSVAQNKAPNYNSEIPYGELKFPKPLAKPSKANQLQTSDDAFGSTKLKLNSTNTGSVSNDELSQSNELINNYGYRDEQKTAEVFSFEPSEQITYMSALPNTFNTANIDNAFERLSEIFVEYSVPISSVVTQLSDVYESTLETPILPTRLLESQNALKNQVSTKNHKRPDTIADMMTYDGPDSAELDYGFGYTILQSLVNSLNFTLTKEKASDENGSVEKISQEIAYSKEECNGVCAEDSEDEAFEFNQLNQPTVKYQLAEYGASNESEPELNYTSATENSNINVVTTKTPAPKTKLSTTKILSLFNAAASQFPTYSIATIVTKPANNLEHLEVAIENDVRKEIENIDKTNEMQKETFHQQQQQPQHFAADTELLAQNTNDKSAWAATGLQHISVPLSAQLGKATIVENAKGEYIRVPKPEVMCSKTEIIKSEQYSKTNENENGNENENEIENEKTEIISGGRVLLGRSLSYTISCHISKHEQPATILRTIYAANITDEIDNNREKMIKNHEQLTISSAADSRNGLPVGHRKPEDVEAIERRPERNDSGYKANDGAADKGVGSADIDGSGYYDEGNEGEYRKEDDKESGENYYIDGVAHEIDSGARAEADTDGDIDVDVDDYVTSAALLNVNGIQSRGRQAAAMTTVAQLTTSLETDNDKTYEYDTRQPLQGGLSDNDVNFKGVEHVAASAVNSKNAKQMDSNGGNAEEDYHEDGDYDGNDDDDDDDHNHGDTSIDAVEFVTSDYVVENVRKYREPPKAANVDSGDRARDSIAVAIDADGMVGVHNTLQYKLTKAEAAAVEEQESMENYNAELLKTETESTKLKNASGGVSDANSDAGDEDEEMADVSGAAVDAKTEDSSAAAATSVAATDPMISVLDDTKPNVDDVKSAQSNA